MTTIKKVIRTINERPSAALYFRLLIGGCIVVPIFVFIHFFDIISEVDYFIDKEFNGETITDVKEFEMTTSRGVYKKIKVNGQDLPTYPILITDFYSDSLIHIGQTIWKEAKSKQFKIKTGTREINYELNDQRKSRKIELIIMLTMVIGLFGLLTFLGTLDWK